MSDQAAIVERLEEVIDMLEVALERQRAENARLRRVEAAAALALADLDAMLDDADAGDSNHVQAGHGG